MNRKSKVLALTCCLALLFCFCVSSLAAEAEPKVGQQIGAVKFAPPISEEDAKYLGLDKVREFTLKDVTAPYVLVEQFSTTCPHCMTQAPVLNKLFNLVQQDAALKGKVKFMAVGQNNDESALKGWKAFHKVPFPLIPDPKSGLGKALNFSPYPVTMVMDKNGKIVFVHVGAFESAEEVLKSLKTTLK
jgi:peroxiredoxin